MATNTARDLEGIDMIISTRTYRTVLFAIIAVGVILVVPAFMGYVPMFLQWVLFTGVLLWTTLFALQRRQSPRDRK